MLAVAIRVVILAVVGAAIGLGFNQVRPGGVGFQLAEKVEVCEAEAVGITEVAPQDASDACAAFETVILDVRSEERYAEGHVAGAIHLPCNAGSVGEDTTGLLARADLILVYGSTTEEARPVAQAIAQRHPDRQVEVLAGGYPAWEAAGLACVSGPCECTGSHL